MAKSKKAAPSPKLTKKQLSRRRRERLQRLWIWIGLAVVAVAIVAVLAVGAVTQLVRTVAVVNGEAIKTSEYQKRARYYYYAYGPEAFQDETGAQSEELHRLIVDQLIEEELIRQEALKRGIAATDDEIQIEIEENWFQHFRNPPVPTPSPTVDPIATPTPEGTPPAPTATPDTPETFEANYDLFVDRVLKPARVGESYLRELAEISVLSDKLGQAMGSSAPTEEEQVRFRYTSAPDGESAANKIAEYEAGTRTETLARHILVETEDEAKAVLQRLQDGEDFAALAAELSLDTSNKDQGGDLGWFARGQMVPEFEQVAFEGDIGLHPEPVATDYGFHVLEVLDRQERPVDLEAELFDAGWYGKSQLARDFGPLGAEMLFNAELGLFPEPVPTEFGVAIVELLDHQVRPLDQDEQESRRQEAFQEWLDAAREEGDIEEHWDKSMIPARM